MARVRDEVHEDLRELLGEASDEDALGREEALDAAVRVVEDVLAEREGLIDDTMERHGDVGLAGGARVRHEVTREPEHTRRALADAPEPLDVLGLTAHDELLAQEHVGVSDDRGEGVIELVHDAGGELTERRELLGLHEVRRQGAHLARGELLAFVRARAFDTSLHGEGRAAHHVVLGGGLPTERPLGEPQVERDPFTGLDHDLGGEPGKEARRTIAERERGARRGHVPHDTRGLTGPNDVRPDAVIREDLREGAHRPLDHGVLSEVRRDGARGDEELVEPPRGHVGHAELHAGARLVEHHTVRRVPRRLARGHAHLGRLGHERHRRHRGDGLRTGAHERLPSGAGAGAVLSLARSRSKMFCLPT